MSAPDAATSVEVARVADALARRRPRAGATKVLAIDGRSGAGKTTFARAVAGAMHAPLVQLEYVYPGWDGLAAGVELLVDALLSPLAAGRTATVPQWDYPRNGWGAPLTVEPAELIVVEGVGAGARRAAPYASLVVWLELSAAARRARAFARDAGGFRAQWRRWAAQEDALLAREHTAARADLVVRMG